jgi:hypothetical protein
VCVCRRFCACWCGWCHRVARPFLLYSRLSSRQRHNGAQKQSSSVSTASHAPREPTQTRYCISPRCSACTVRCCLSLAQLIPARHEEAAKGVYLEAANVEPPLVHPAGRAARPAGERRARRSKKKEQQEEHPPKKALSGTAASSRLNT